MFIAFGYSWKLDFGDNVVETIVQIAFGTNFYDVPPSVISHPDQTGGHAKSGATNAWGGVNVLLCFRLEPRLCRPTPVAFGAGAA